ncbi:MAG: hypothetical protein PHV30_06840 [Candidatus Margulisbacteria bacterium]|nr:hypothetical protein [Candidatus Margulisiibacteriota bacterium]
MKHKIITIDKTQKNDFFNIKLENLVLILLDQNTSNEIRNDVYRNLISNISPYLHYSHIKKVQLMYEELLKHLAEIDLKPKSGISGCINGLIFQALNVMLSSDLQLLRKDQLQRIIELYEKYDTHIGMVDIAESILKLPETEE